MNRVKIKFSESLRIIWAIAAKDIIDAIKNKTTVSIIIGMAVMMLMNQALPFLLDLKDTHIVSIYDAGESNLVDALKDNGTMEVRKVPSQTELESVLSESLEPSLGLTIPSGFDQLVHTDGVIQLEGYVSHWAKTDSMTERVAFFERHIGEIVGKPVHINVEGNVVFPQPDASGQSFMVAMSLTLVTAVIGAFLAPYLIIEEKEKHTLDALMVSPASYPQVVIGKALAGAFYCLTATGVVLAFNRVMVNHWGLAFLAVVCGALFTVAIGLLMGILFENPATMNLWLGLVIMVLIVPVLLIDAAGPNWPEIVRAILPWFPSVALMNVFRISFAGRVPIDLLLLNLGIMAGSAVLILILVVWRVRCMDR